jgi:hypothetical protein
MFVTAKALWYLPRMQDAPSDAIDTSLVPRMVGVAVIGVP